MSTAPSDLSLSYSLLTPASLRSHVLRYLADADDTAIEITGSQMVLCMKLISFAWSTYDGRQPDAALDPTQRASKISTTPGLIPFLGYT